MKYYNPEMELLVNALLENKRELIYNIDSVKGVQCNPEIKCGFTRASVEHFINSVILADKVSFKTIKELNSELETYICLLKVHGTLSSELEALGVV